MKANQRSSFIRLSKKLKRKSKWNVQAEDGKKKGKCVGNGREKNSEKKSASVKQEELEVNNFIICFL